jgi:predicted ATPase
MQNYTYSRHVILSGCSGGGKSTLLEELAQREFQTVPEPGRRIVAEEQRGEGKALPWVSLEAFARRAIEMSSRDREQFSSADSWVFFDRGLIDAAVALEHATGIAASDTVSKTARYHHQVFLTPPWLEIYETDSERQHSFDEALAEYQRLLATFEQLGYDVIILPKIDVKNRADFVLRRLC